MTSLTALPQAIAAILSTEDTLDGVPIIQSFSKTVTGDVETALAGSGQCIWVMPALPKDTLRTDTAAIFFRSVEVRIRLLDRPSVSPSPGNIHELVGLVPLCLQGINPDDLCAEGLSLSATPVTTGMEGSDLYFDLTFTAAMHLFAVELEP